jgi:hypothetical protein
MRAKIRQAEGIATWVQIVVTAAIATWERIVVEEILSVIAI